MHTILRILATLRALLHGQGYAIAHVSVYHYGLCLSAVCVFMSTDHHAHRYLHMYTYAHMYVISMCASQRCELFTETFVRHRCEK